MFIDLKDIEYEVLIDVRSYEEYIQMPLCHYNIPIINQEYHEFLKNHIYLAILIILYGLIKNRKMIRQELLNKSNNRKNTLVIACSQGRLRSPIVYIYSRLIGIESKILKGGIKQYYQPKRTKNKWMSWFEI